MKKPNKPRRERPTNGNQVLAWMRYDQIRLCYEPTRCCWSLVGIVTGRPMYPRHDAISAQAAKEAIASGQLRNIAERLGKSANENIFYELKNHR